MVWRRARAHLSQCEALFAQGAASVRAAGAMASDKGECQITSFTMAAATRLPEELTARPGPPSVPLVRIASPEPFPFTETVATIAWRLRADARHPRPQSHG